MSKKFCQNCGEGNSSEKNFCLNCGQSLNDLPPTVFIPPPTFASYAVAASLYRNSAPTVFASTQRQFSTAPNKQNFQFQPVAEPTPAKSHKILSIMALVFSIVFSLLFLFPYLRRRSFVDFPFLFALWLIGFFISLAAVILGFIVPKYFGGRAIAVSSLIINLIILMPLAFRLYYFISAAYFN